MYFIKGAIFSLFVFAVLFAGSAAAQEVSSQAVLDAETVTSADLGVGNPRLLPTSPFYFFKEMGRGLQRAFTFNAVAKTELELNIASEKAAEAAKVAEQDSGNERGIARALANYERGQERLRSRLEHLRETSENPNVDRLLDKVAERAVLHQKLLEDIEGKHKAQERAAESIRTRLQDTLSEVAKKDTADKFQQRLERALENTKGSTLKYVRDLDMLDRLHEADDLPEEVKQKLQELRVKVSEQAGRSVENFTKEGQEGADRLKDSLRKIPGDAVRRSVILEEIRGQVSDRTSDALQEARDSIDRTIDETDEFAQKVRAQIESSEKKLQRIESKLKEGGKEIPFVVTSLIEQAKDQLTKAKVALQQGNPKEAFGLARSAEAIIANVFRWVERGIEAIQRTPQELERILDKINIISIVPQEKPANRETEPDATGEIVACTLQYDPVCGADGKTYGNKCIAESQAKVRIVHKGECRDTTVADPVLPCPLIDLESFTRDCQSKGGKVTIKQDLRCGAMPACQKPDALLQKTEAKDILRAEQESVPVSPSALEPAPQKITLDADDAGFYPSGKITVPRGTSVTLTFNVKTQGVYYAGLDFKSTKFATASIRPGESVTVTFVADESFEFKSYWPATGVLKAIGKVVVE